MYNELRFAGWTVEQRAGWERTGVKTPGCDEPVNCSRNTGIPGRQTCRLITVNASTRMQLSLDGLGLGDALGEMLSYRSDECNPAAGPERTPGRSLVSYR